MINEIVQNIQRAVAAMGDARDAAIAANGRGCSQDDATRISLTINNLLAEEAYWVSRAKNSM